MKRLILALILLWPSAAAAQSYTLAPDPYQTVLDNTGLIVNGACVWTYLAGTTTPIATYADTNGTPNTNPIVADSAGRFAAFLVPGNSYKFIYENVPCAVSPPTHGPVLRTADGIQAVPASSATVDISSALAGESISLGQCAYLSDGSGSKVAGSWYKCDSANTYSSTLPEVGLAIAAITSGNTGTIRLAGEVTGLAALVVGGEYFAASAGAITNTAPTNARHLGHADTATSMVLTADPAAKLQRVSGLDIVTGLLDVTNTPTETAVYTFTVPGGTLSTNRALRLTITGFMSLTTTGDNLAVRVKYGGTTMAITADSFAAPTSGPFELVFYLVGAGTTGAQWTMTKYIRPTTGTTVAGPTDLTNTTPLLKAAYTTAAIDSTANQVLTVTAQWTGTLSTDHFQRYHAMLEWIQ